MKLQSVALALVLALSPTMAVAQTPPMPTIEDAGWLAGRWVGEGLGGVVEETWAPAADGQMVGHFRLVRGGAVVFYEIMLIDVAEAGLRLRVKHFHPTFVGWEEKDVWVTFEPQSVSTDAIEFRGLTLRRLSEHEAEFIVRLRDADGVREETLRVRRAPL